MSDMRRVVPVLVLLIFPVYVSVVGVLPSDISFNACQPSAEGESVGFCTEVSATVQRSYYFGFVELPTRVLGVNIDSANRLIGPFALFLSALSYTFLNKDKK